MNATAEEIELAEKLHAIGVRAQTASCERTGIALVTNRWTFASLDTHQQEAWFAVARHVSAAFTPNHDYAPAPAEKGTS